MFNAFAPPGPRRPRLVRRDARPSHPGRRCRAGDDCRHLARQRPLVDAKGMTLYTFAKDTDGKSACNGPCARQLARARRDPRPQTPRRPTQSSPATDGAKQWAYNGKPLYTFAKDKKAGDTAGEGLPQRRLARRQALRLGPMTHR